MSKVHPQKQPGFYINSKCKTFQKGQDWSDILNFVTDYPFETNDYTPDGTDWSGGEPGPHDPVSELTKKYVVCIKQVR